MNAPPRAQNPNGGRRSEGTNCHRSTRWVKFRELLFWRNPLCQKILPSGLRCTHKSEILHHLVSPLDDASKQFRADNCVFLCRSHHPNTRGTPWWRVGIDYVRTVGFGDPQLSEEEFAGKVGAGQL